MGLNITWKSGKGLPVLVKGGAMGLVDGAPVYACGMTYPWRETEQAWYWEEGEGGAFVTRHLDHYEVLDLDDLEAGWGDRGKLPFAPLVGSACASVDGTFYVFGGYECWTEDGQRRIKQHASAWRYDFAADTWTRLADCPVVASGWCAAACGKTIFLLGGGFSFELGGVAANYHTFHALESGTPRQRLIGAYSDLVFVYDIEADSYRALQERLPVGLNDLRCTVKDDTIYAAGGETVDPATSNTSNSFMVGQIK
jgi:hypothetical protein